MRSIAGLVLGRPTGVPIALGGVVSGLVAADGDVWAATGSLGTPSRIQRISIATDRPVGSPITLAPDGAPVVTAGSGVIWVAVGDMHTVTRIDAADRGLLGAPAQTGPDPTAIAIGAGSVWVADTAGAIRNVGG
jgi:hypothetical protein